MAMIQANKANDKAIQALRDSHKTANIPTEIKEENKDYFNILGCNLVQMTGVSTRLDTAVFTISKRDYELLNARKEFHAASFGYNEIHVLHDPTFVEKPKKEKAEPEKQ